MICPACGHDNLPGAETCEACLWDLMDVGLPAPRAGLQKQLMEDTVTCLLLAHPVAVSRRDTVSAAIAAMKREGVGCALVIEREKLVGIFTERDVLFKLALPGLDLDRISVEEVMVPDPVTLREHDTLAMALHQMSLGGFRHLPVVTADGRPLGVVSVRDLFRYITRGRDPEGIRDVTTQEDAPL